MAEGKKTKITPVFDLLGQAVVMWWKNLRKIIMIYLWGLLFALIPLVVLLLLIGIGSIGAVSSHLAFKIIVVFLGFWSVALAIYFAARAYLSIFLLVKEDFKGQELKIYKESAKYFWSYLALALLMMVLILLWFLALVIPAIIFTVFYSLAVYAFFFEGKREYEAIKRSYELVKGYWWEVFGRFLFLGLVFWLVMMILSLPLKFIAVDSLGWQIWNGLVQVISFLIGPVALLYNYRVYSDLVKIKK